MTSMPSAPGSAASSRPHSRITANTAGLSIASAQAARTSLRPPYHPFTFDDCIQFLLTECGNYLEIPRIWDYDSGINQILVCLSERYGTRRAGQYTIALKSFLSEVTVGESDRSVALWAPWRIQFQMTGVSIVCLCVS